MYKFRFVSAVQFARASTVPAGRNSRNIGKGVKGFKLVMVIGGQRFKLAIEAAGTGTDL